jgi:hypothetical protein
MKTGKEFYDESLNIDLGIITKEGCITMMELYAGYAIARFSTYKQSEALKRKGRVKELIEFLIDRNKIEDVHIDGIAEEIILTLNDDKFFEANEQMPQSK